MIYGPSKERLLVANTVIEPAFLAETYAQLGFCVLDELISSELTDAIKLDIERLSAIEGRPHTYFDRNGKLRRLEKFTQQSVSVLRANDLVIALLREIFGEDYLLFKDKYNFKPPFGEGFFAHYDGVFKFADHSGRQRDGWYEYADGFVNVLIALDDFTATNGPLEVASWHDADFATLFARTKQNGTPDLIDAEEAKCHFQPILIPKGGVVVFSNKCPHRSKQNLSEGSRGSLYLTYNAASKGDFYDRYFQDKEGSQNKTSKSLSGDI
jgi:2-aminoethylphosphonate dioxygenase